jgi:hypothetical protein
VKRSAIYLAAAKRIDAGRERYIYDGLLGAEAALRMGELFSDRGDDGLYFEDGVEGREHRVLALLVMHQIALDEERS